MVRTSYDAHYIRLVVCTELKEKDYHKYIVPLLEIKFMLLNSFDLNILAQLILMKSTLIEMFVHCLMQCSFLIINVVQTKLLHLL